MNGRYSPATLLAVPISAVQNGLYILRRCLANAGILGNYSGIVEHQSPMEGIGIGNKNQPQDREQPPSRAVAASGLSLQPRSLVWRPAETHSRGLRRLSIFLT